ncbi:unnamed protein product [Notodromas monacha]|uniref:Zinc transporter ZIP1 n=1 Tax=Notodromas monacha TaxID=399045 RepID=A0A7R9BMB4_9CRUS|nr:unnamed protein product [Notodromas monacha]CAG0917022.1 unnamed protein product [Notodromas monacha]
MTDTTNAKVVSLFGLFFGTVFCGIFPIKVEQLLAAWHSYGDHESAARRSRWGDTLLSWLLCFGGGVLFATCFIHMIPEVREGFSAAKWDEDEFPWTELVISCGFFMIYFVEEIIHWALCLHAGHAHHAAETRTIRSCAANPYEPNRRSAAGPGGLSHPQADPVVPKFSLERSVEFTRNDVSNSSQASGASALKSKRRSVRGADDPVSSRSMATSGETWNIEEDGSVGASYLSRSLDSQESAKRKEATRLRIITEGHPKSYGAISVGLPNAGCQAAMITVANDVAQVPIVAVVDRDHGQQRSWSLVHEQAISPIRSVFIILALSFHSLFEGLAIGLQNTPTDVWYLFAAVSFHKFVITFCVGLELVVGGVRKMMVFLYIFVFALVSPIGVAIGIGLSETTGSTQVETLTTTFLSGIAAGTLLYVTFFEVLQREREREGNGVFRVVFVIAGYVCMIALEMIHGHGHSHDADPTVV